MLCVKEYIIANLIPPSSDEKTEAQTSDLPKVRRLLSSKPENNHQMLITEQERQKVNSVPFKHEPTGVPEAAPEAVSGESAVPFWERKVILHGGHRLTGHLPRSHCTVSRKAQRLPLCPSLPLLAPRSFSSLLKTLLRPFPRRK